MQFDTDNFNARAELIKNFLQFGFGFIFYFAAISGDNRLHFGLSDNFTQNGLGCNLNRYVRAAHIKEVVFRVFNAPNDSLVDVNDIFIARQHMAFRERICMIAVSRFTDGDTAFLSDVDFIDAFYRIRQVIVQTCICRVGVGAETQDNALFARLNLIKAGQQPDRQQGKDCPCDFKVKTVIIF